MRRALSAVPAFFLLVSVAQAKTCNVEIEGNDAMQFDKSEIKVAADCSKVSLTLRHVGKLPAAAMGHNWVLTEAADFDALTAATLAAAATQYVPKDDRRVIAHTALIGGGEKASVEFSTRTLRKGGEYLFFCSFPGHWAVMKGRFIFG